MICVKNLTKSYHTGAGEVLALNGVSLEIKPGEFLAIIGQSGSGKSTLMNLLGCLDVPTRGEYWFKNRRISDLNRDQLSGIRNRDIGFIFQGFNLLSRLNAIENVELPLIYAEITPQKRREIALVALDRVGLSSRLFHNPTQLSGGQQQRVAIARAIASKPSLILADEPTGNLDAQSGAEVLSLLKELNNDGATVILITHDSSIAQKARRIVKISAGQIESDKILIED